MCSHQQIVTPTRKIRTFGQVPLSFLLTLKVSFSVRCTVWEDPLPLPVAGSPSPGAATSSRSAWKERDCWVQEKLGWIRKTGIPSEFTKTQSTKPWEHYARSHAWSKGCGKLGTFLRMEILYKSRLLRGMLRRQISPCFTQLFLA